MANLDVQFYDYNGSIFAFGCISGYSNVGSARMYVSNGRGTTYYYCSSQIYSQNTARINTGRYPAPVFFFNIRTDRDAEPGQPAQLDYNVVDPEDSSGRGRYKISFHFYSSSNGTGNPLNDTALKPYINGQSDVWFQMHHSLPAPHASFDSTNNILTVTGAGSHRCNIRITRKNRVHNPDFPPEIRDYAYKVNMQSLEGTAGGKYTENYPYWVQDYNSTDDIECKYQRGGIDYTQYTSTKVRVLFDSGANYTQSDISNYLTIINRALDEISSYTGLVFDVSYEVWDDYINKTKNEIDEYLSEEYDTAAVGYLMYIRIGNNSSMTLNEQYNGYWAFYTWSNWRAEGIKWEANHSTSIACINTSHSSNNESVAHVIHEEIYQSLNIGNDCFDYPLSIHYDPHYTNPDMYDLQDAFNDNISWDKEVLRFFYTNNLAGKTPIELINEFDTPCCLVKNGNSSERTFDLSALNNDTYIVEAWLCDAGAGNPGGITQSAGHYNWDGGWDDAPYSLHYRTEITIQKLSKPDKWVWSTNIGIGKLLPITSHGIHPMTYTEWNNFTKRINEFRQYKGYSEYAFTQVVQYQEFTANIYNEAVEAIKGVSGYGEFIYYINNTTLAVDNCIFKISLLNDLAAEANSIAGYT